MTLLWTMFGIGMTKRGKLLKGEVHRNLRSHLSMKRISFQSSIARAKSGTNLNTSIWHTCLLKLDQLWHFHSLKKVFKIHVLITSKLKLLFTKSVLIGLQRPRMKVLGFPYQRSRQICWKSMTSMIKESFWKRWCQVFSKVWIN